MVKHIKEFNSNVYEIIFTFTDTKHTAPHHTEHITQKYINDELIYNTNHIRQLYRTANKGEVTNWMKNPTDREKFRMHAETNPPAVTTSQLYMKTYWFRVRREGTAGRVPSGNMISISHTLVDVTCDHEKVSQFQQNQPKSNSFSSSPRPTTTRFAGDI